jgi:hypothetical protein
MNTSSVVRDNCRSGFLQNLEKHRVVQPTNPESLAPGRQNCVPLVYLSEVPNSQLRSRKRFMASSTTHC